MSEASTQATTPGQWFATVPVEAVRQAAVDKKPVAFRLAGQDLVIWLSDAGGFIVQEDRCAHVDAELTTGICGGDVLVCAYHGWTHHPDGHARPPGARNWKTPAKGWKRIKTYKTASGLGMLWMWSVPDMPETPTFDLPLETVRPRTLTVAQPAASAHALARTTLGEASGGEENAFAVSISPDVAAFAVTPMSDNQTQLCLFVRPGREAEVDRLIDQLASAAAREATA